MQRFQGAWRMARGVLCVVCVGIYFITFIGDFFCFIVACQSDSSATDDKYSTVQNVIILPFFHASLQACRYHDRSQKMQKLMLAGIHGNLYGWFTSYVKNRMQEVVLYGHTSNWKYTPSGVQYKVPSCLLFSSRI